MKKIILTLALALPMLAMAQYDKPYYLPGEGIYIAGLNPDLTPSTAQPTMITQAYKAKFNVFGTEVASIKAGTKSYNVSDKLSEDGKVLDLVSFMGIGQAKSLTVRNLDGESYNIGDNAPEKTWDTTYLVAAENKFGKKATYPLGMYDHWDCQVTTIQDPMLGQGKSDLVKVSFSNPHEGLVMKNINFPLIVEKGTTPDGTLCVELKVWDSSRHEIIDELMTVINISEMQQAGTTDNGDYIYKAVATLSNVNIILATPFDVCVSGFSQEDVHAWIPRAVDTIGIYPTHTSYDNDAKNASSDACINVEGYFNYLGTWGWWDGKYERGEVVATADYVQVYYDPSDPDWPGDYFMGEVAFPVECTFGYTDITYKEKPEWINSVETDDSQWAEHGAVQLVMSADALPSDMTGRNGKVVFTTLDGASQYTIYIRQGAASFDIDAVNTPVISIPSKGGVFDLSGRIISDKNATPIYIKDGKKFINK